MRTTSILCAIAAVVPLFVTGQRIVCSGGQGEVQFNPGVKMSIGGPITIQGSGGLTACSSGEETHIDGSWSFEGQGFGSCTGKPIEGNGMMSISWGDGTTTSFPEATFNGAYMKSRL
jgi:hypothetical protein